MANEEHLALLKQSTDDWNHWRAGNAEITPDLSRANLEGADLGRAIIGYTSFSDIDLGEVKGLESVIHDEPSSIGVDTILTSQGAIPEEFLRGCGYNPTVTDYRTDS